MPCPSAARAVLALALLSLVALPRTAGAAAVAVGTNGISMSSSTVGATWNSPVTIDGAVSFSGVWFFSESGGIAVGNNNSIHRTTNGGANWSPISSPITTTYNDVMFPTATTGYIAATNGQVLKTTNGGTSWSAQSTPSPGSLLGIHFVSATQGCAVGMSGAIVRTTDGGSNWIDETTGSAALADVFFFDASNGWVVGTGGTILRTTNGGNSWSTVTSGTTVDLTGVWFTSATRGFVCGGDRVLRTTTNGGTSWSAITLSGTSQQSGLFDVMFADSDSGIVVGSGHNAFRTIDGGTTWTIANPDPTNEVLQAVHLSRPPGPPPQVTITVNTVPAGRSFTFDGTTFTSQQSFTFDSGSSHTLSVPTPQTINAGERYAFTQWSGGSTSTSSSISLSPTSNATFTANLQRQFLLTMPGVTGGSTSPGTGWRNAGSSLSISANDGTGYDFASWTGAGSGSYSGTNNPASITMNGPITQTATFTAVAITLSFVTVPAGKQVIVDGTTRTTPYSLATTADVAHTIDVPTPQGEANGTRLAFQSWSDGGSRSHLIDPLVSTTYTATLKTQHFLTTLASPAHGGTLNPADAWHDAGSRVDLTAVANPGWTFYLMGGSGSGSLTAFPRDVGSCTMNAPITQTAYFSNATMRTIVVQASPPGPHLSIGSIDIGSHESFLWPSGDVLQLSAPATETAIANVKQWQYTGWSDGLPRVHTVTPTSNKTYTASFDVQFQLSMSAETGGTTTPAPGNSWVDSNTVVPITALPDVNHSFQSWSGTGSSSYSGSNNPANFTIRGKVAELARFDLLPRLTLPDLTADERRFVAGEPETLRWDANYASTTAVRLEYKHSIASTWNLIGTATPQTELLVWTPPDAPQTSLQLRILSPSPNVIADTLSGTFQICDPYFNPGPAIASLAADAAPLDVVPLDINLDGVLDLAIATAQGLVTRLGTAGAPGTGTGGFAAPVTLAYPEGANRLAVLDFDNDGDPDLAVTPRTSASQLSLSIARNGTNGAPGAYANHLSMIVPAYGRFDDVVATDFDEDGIQDLVALFADDAKLGVYRGNGTDGVPSGTFGGLGESSTIAAATRMRLADLDLDGRPDLVVIGTSPPRLAVQFGRALPIGGNPAFGPPQSLTLPEIPGDVALADFDEDGFFDAVWSAPLDGRIFVTKAVGAEGPSGELFQGTDTVATGAFFARLAVADFDRDGHADVVAVDPGTDKTTIWRGRGDATFAFLASRAGAGEASHATVQDFLEDGRSDLLLTDANGPTKLFAGDLVSCEPFGGSIVILDAPNAAGLAFTVGQEATISWRPFGGGVILADLDVSRDNGVTWRSIARGIVQRSFSWTVTPPLTTQGRIRVRSSTGHAIDDVSTNAFSIVQGAVDVPPGAALPTMPAFAPPSPNPARGAVRLALDLPAPARVSLVLYDVAGRRVRTVVAGDLPAGAHAFAWDGTDDGGRKVAAGVYFARGRWENFAAERRFVWMP